MNDPCTLELARYQGPHTVDLVNSATANVKEATT